MIWYDLSSLLRSTFSQKRRKELTLSFALAPFRRSVRLTCVVHDARPRRSFIPSPRVLTLLRIPYQGVRIRAHTPHIKYIRRESSFLWATLRARARTQIIIKFYGVNELKSNYARSPESHESPREMFVSRAPSQFFSPRVFVDNTHTRARD